MGYAIGYVTGCVTVCVTGCVVYCIVPNNVMLDSVSSSLSWQHVQQLVPVAIATSSYYSM